MVVDLSYAESVLKGEVAEQASFADRVVDPGHDADRTA